MVRLARLRWRQELETEFPNLSKDLLFLLA